MSLSKADVRDHVRTCSKCGVAKPTTDFYARYGQCKGCTADVQKAWEDRNPERRREYSRRHQLGKTYGLTLEQYDAMFAAQAGVCAICARPEKTRRNLAVDHDHETGAIRKLLCIDCNALIGHARENVETLKAAINYLEGRRVSQ